MDLLLIIRGLAAIAVVFGHARGYEVDLPLFNVPGRTAVWIFFGISGYVIAYGFLHGRYRISVTSLKHFYLNRFLRIYPLFLLLSLVGWLTIWASSGTNPIEWQDFPGQFLGLQFNHEYKLNSVFWTLGLEIQFYSIAPALVTLFFIKSVRIRWLTITAVYVGSVAFNWSAIRFMGWSVDGRNILSVLPHFLAGMIGCGLVASLRVSRSKAIGFLMVGCIFLVASNWVYHRQSAWFWGVQGTVLVDGAILLFIYAHSNLQPQQLTYSPVIRVLLGMGTLSYGIYAWHAYLMSYIDWLTSNDWFALLLFSTAFAYVTYRRVELPSMRLKRWQGT